MGNALRKSYQMTEDAKVLARGHWNVILRVLCPELEAAQGRCGKHVDCPLPNHGGKGDFRLLRGYEDEGRAACTCGKYDGFHLIRLLRGWDFPETVRAVLDIVGGKYDDVIKATPRPEPNRAKIEKDDQHIKSTITQWWSEAMPLDAPEAKIARTYLKNRKVGEVLMPIDDIRFHPSLAYFGETREQIGRFPALIALVRRPNGSISTVHRTYLTPEGRKAFDGEQARKQYRAPSTSPVTGGAIRIDAEVGRVLNLAEGIETALAVRAITRQPTWSTLNKELLMKVEIPDQVELVSIWADKDRSRAGEEAAIKLMDKLRGQGRKAVVVVPPFSIPEDAKGVDWNDVVARLGRDWTADLDVVRQWSDGAATFTK